jgi:hypothetical protein
LRLLRAPGGVASGFEAKAAFEEADCQDDEEGERHSDDPSDDTLEAIEHRSSEDGRDESPDAESIITAVLKDEEHAIGDRE